MIRKNLAVRNGEVSNSLSSVLSIQTCVQDCKAFRVLTNGDTFEGDDAGFRCKVLDRSFDRLCVVEGKELAK